MITEKKFKVVLETLEPFRIGGKEDPLSGAETPVARVGNRVVVPGSSLKGAFRAEVEGFLINTYFQGEWSENEKNLQPCIPTTEISADEWKLVNEGKYRDMKVKGRYRGCHYPCKDRDCNEAHSICPVCYLFGAQGLNGFLRVPFLYVDISTSELYSARIDRAKKVVSERTNRPYELIPEGTKFEGELFLLAEDDILGWKFGEPRPLKDKTLGDKWLEEGEFNEETILKDFVIERLKSINMLGGYKSKGFGRVKITVNAE